jgi:hypothetical protein
VQRDGCQVIAPGGINANLAPDAFLRWANHYYQCRQSFQSPHSFSPVPYFLLCRAIELAIKARHLTTLTQEDVKGIFGHDLLKAYMALAPAQRVLGADEERILKAASQIYAEKGFEYFDPEDALTAFRRYPQLDDLATIARKLVSA